MMILLNWVRENFFGSKLDVILSILGAFFIYFILSTVISFIINSDWTLILVNRQLMLTGLMPEEEIWRVWTIFSLTVILMTTSVAFWFNINIKGSIFYNFPSNKTFDLSDVFEDLSNKSLLAGLEIYDRFYEIGSINGLNDTIDFFKKLDNK